MKRPQKISSTGYLSSSVSGSRVFHVKQGSPHILLINPWITDFAAYNFWIRPHGLLSVASLLRRHGCEITFIDCLEAFATRKKYGDGKFCRVEIEKPPQLKAIPRRYCRYGIREEELRRRIGRMARPDLVGITSGMTYWYPGVLRVVEIVREYFKEVPILLGGIYATLCYEKALEYSGADHVIRGPIEEELFKIVAEFVGVPISESNSSPAPGRHPYPAFDLYAQPTYVSVITSQGCPFRCPYCASFLLYPTFKRRDPDEVVGEVDYWTRNYGVANIAFYDDALLHEPYEHIIPILKEIKRRGMECNFHAPNGLHIREIDQEVASLMYDCRFRTIRLSLETSNEKAQADMGGKVDNQSFREAVRYLKRAGYRSEEIGVYIIAGLPKQEAEEVEESIAYVKEAGATPKLVEYSPIPGTPLFENAKRVSRFDIENEPLFHNNSLFPCEWEGFTQTDLKRLKEAAK